MDCWYPQVVGRRHNYKGKDGLVYTRVYGRITVPCGRCPACRRRKQNEWAFRVMEEVKHSRSAFFITLTYSDEFLPYSDSGVPTLDPDRIHKLTKDLRYNLDYRYFLCGEYGDLFDRPHYHMILFTNDDITVDDLTGILESRWPDGFVKVDYPVTAGRAKYCAKYSMKRLGFDYGDCVPPFARMSRRPGIGKKFLDDLNVVQYRRQDLWFLHDYQGTPYALPRYYREKIYSKDECDQHALLLEKVKNSKLDIDLAVMDNYWKHSTDVILSREKQFIKQLKKENYGYKFKGFIPKSQIPRYTSRGEEFISDEF